MAAAVVVVLRGGGGPGVGLRAGIAARTQFPPSPGSLTDSEAATAALRRPAAAFERRRPSHLQHAHFLRNKTSTGAHTRTHAHVHARAPSVSASVARERLFSFMSTEKPSSIIAAAPLADFWQLLLYFLLRRPKGKRRSCFPPLSSPSLQPPASSHPAFLHRQHHKRIF